MLTGEKRIYEGELCLECGKMASETHHCIFGKNRQNSEDYGLTVHLCNRCHWRLHNVDEVLAMKYRKIGQIVFEARHSHEEFMWIFGRNYL